MIDFSPHITLTPRHARIYRYARAALFSTAATGAIALAAAILFPTARGTFDFTRPNAQSNTIAIMKDGGATITATYAAYGAYDRMRVTLTFRDVPALPPRITIYKGIRAMLLPLRDAAHAAALRDTPLHSGTLFTYRNGIWIADNDVIRPIADMDTFRAKGYDFAAVRRDITAEERSAYTKGKLLTLRDDHAAGTVFRDRNDGRLYRHHGDVLVPITTAPPQVSIVAADRATATRTVECAPRRHILYRTTYTCTISLDALRALPGTDYIARITGAQPQRITIALRRAITVANLRATLIQIRDRIRHRYIQ